MKTSTLIDVLQRCAASLDYAAESFPYPRSLVLREDAARAKAMIEMLRHEAEPRELGPSLLSEHEQNPS